jgi:hypothetical protein
MKPVVEATERDTGQRDAGERGDRVLSRRDRLRELPFITPARALRH